MAVNLNNISGESFGDINDVFFKKNGKSILPQQNTVDPSDKINPQEIADKVAETVNRAANTEVTTKGNTIINISKDIIGDDEDLQIELTQLEEKRKNTSTTRNKHFVDLDTGEEIVIIEHTEMYNGANLFTAKHLSNGKVITYPRSMFIGKGKRFVPKVFYLREAERSLEDTIDKFSKDITDIIKDPTQLSETSDGKYLELVLETPLDIVGGMVIPDKVQIPIKRMFDMHYKIMLLEFVICLDNKIASLLFIDVWF